MTEKVSDGGTPTKRCTKCGEVKPLDAFANLRSRGRTYKYSYCKDCEYIRRRAWFARNRERLNKKFREEATPQQREAKRSWSRKNKEKAAESGRNFTRRAIDNLSDGYVCKLLGIGVLNCSPELIELKRQQIQVSRALKQLKEKANGK